MAQGEVGAALADPNAAVEIAFGPPFPELIPQDSNSGLKFAGLYEEKPKRMVFKKAYFSLDDFRIFDQASGRLICNSHHFGKNPYTTFNQLVCDSYAVEVEARCNVTGAEQCLFLQS